jgi:hypothetical protein
VERGTSAAYLAARIKRDYPAIAERLSLAKHGEIGGGHGRDYNVISDQRCIDIIHKISNSSKVDDN